MIRARVDTPPEILREQPACRIFGEPRLCVFPVGSCVCLNMWWADDSRRMEINCDDMPTALAFIDRVRQTELDELVCRYWCRYPISEADLVAQMAGYVR